jgi:hypothetical protein
MFMKESHTMESVDKNFLKICVCMCVQLLNYIKPKLAVLRRTTYIFRINY